MKTHLFVSRHPHIFGEVCTALCSNVIANPKPVSQADPEEIAEYMGDLSSLRNCATCIRVLLKELATGERLYIYEIVNGQQAKTEEVA